MHEARWSGLDSHRFHRYCGYATCLCRDDEGIDSENRGKVGDWSAGILSAVTDSLPPCPECSSEYTYELGALLVCPECAHEWEATPADEAAGSVIKDAVGNVLADGDTVIVIKNLKVKGNPTPIKVGTKVRNIRLVDGVDGHDIDCKVDGFGSMQLKSSVVKKA